MTEQFKYLFTPIKIGPVVVKNRIVSAAHITLYGFHAEESGPEREIEYQRARAKGGCGLIILSGASLNWAMIDPASCIQGHRVMSPESVIPRYKMLADAVHEHGAKVFSQVLHFGTQWLSTTILRPPLSFSQSPGLDYKEMPHEMEVEEIERIIDQFAAYSEAAYLGGLDGVELHGTHGYLIQQSWSPWANRRKDEYGEPLKFVMEILKRVRSRVGSNFAVGLRISADDFLPAGLGNAQMQELVKKLEATGLVDFFSCTAGGMLAHYTLTVGPMYIPLGFLVPLHSAIKAAVDHVPVFAAVRINDPIQAEKILADGHADMVVMCRAQIADPELGNKAKEGRFEDIRHCIACVQGCMSRVYTMHPITCLQNPQVGREKETSVEAAAQKKKVMVIGGGPAGTEAARVAAMRGHEVSLYEKEGQLGGQVNIHTRMSFREEFRDVIRWRVLQLSKLGAKVHLNTLVDAGMVKVENPDVVVLAIGSRPSPAPFKGGDQENVVNHEEVLLGIKPVGKKVLMLDHPARSIGLHLADYLAEQGKEVQIVTPAPSPGLYIGFSELPITYQRLMEKEVRFVPHTDIREVSNHTVRLYNVYTQKERLIEDVDTVVYVVANTVDKTLERSLKGVVKELHVIGDCLSPRDALQAIREGFDCGRIL